MSRARTVGLTLIVVLAMLGAGFAGYTGTRAARPVPSPSPTIAPPTPAALALAAATPSTTPAPSGTAARPAAVARVLAPYLDDDALGSRVRARVVDVVSGTTLVDRGGSAPTAPASTAKLVTAVAVLSVRKPTDRITTSLLADDAGTLVLVGAGDPTLSAAPAGSTPEYVGAARLSDLAREVRAAKVPVRRILVDNSAFSGPTVSPDWDKEDVPSSYGAAITAVLSDGGRTLPGDTIRSATPDLDTGRSLARLLGTPKLSVQRGSVPASSGRTIGSVRSAQFGTLVEQMLRESDNVIAECLARQVSLALRRPASFTGAAHAVRAVVTKLGVDPGGQLVDGSGLAPRDRVSATTLVSLLRLAASDQRPGARGVISGLAVAGWSGTLADRFVGGPARAGVGLVRAKTGTLTGVSALAGLVHDRDGRLLAFALLADRAPATAAAEATLDSAAAALSACGCR